MVWWGLELSCCIVGANWSKWEKKAKLFSCVGMEAEHCSESIHPVVNSLHRRYATTQHVCNRLALITKSQWLQSNATLTDYRKPKARKRSRKGKEKGNP